MCWSCVGAGVALALVLRGSLLRSRVEFCRRSPPPRQAAASVPTLTPLATDAFFCRWRLPTHHVASCLGVLTADADATPTLVSRAAFDIRRPGATASSATGALAGASPPMPTHVDDRTGAGLGTCASVSPRLC